MGYKIYAPKPMSDESMEMLRKKGFEIIGEWQDSREDMKKYMAEADVVIARVHFFDDELLALAKNLKLIQVHGVGYQDHVVCEDAAKRGVAVCPGDPFYEEDRNVRTMRINYSNMPDDRIVEGIQRMAKAIKECM